jgi:hypothetical protein
MHTLFLGPSAPRSRNRASRSPGSKRVQCGRPSIQAFRIHFPLPKRMALVVSRLGPARPNLETVRECCVVSPKFEMCPRRGASRSLQELRRKRNRAALPLDSQYPLPTAPKGAFECHSCLRFLLLTTSRYTHNPKVGGSNPPPATKTSQALIPLITN